jgi:hypothetical protein
MEQQRVKIIRPEYTHGELKNFNQQNNLRP